MATKIANVYRIEYEMDKSIWTTFIAGFTQDEVMKKLYTTSGKINKINAVTHECRLDSISNEMIDEVSQPIRMRMMQLEDELKKVTNKTSVTTSTKTTPKEKTTSKISSEIKMS